MVGSHTKALTNNPKSFHCSIKYPELFDIYQLAYREDIPAVFIYFLTIS